MKKLMIISCIAVFLSSFSNSVRGQDTKQIAYNSSDEVLTKPEQMPEFIGGEEKLFEFITSNVKYPDAAKEKGISGKVFVQFVVDKSGKVRDSKILRGIGSGCDEEVLRVMSIMPDWIPGNDGGKLVSVMYNLPFSFALNAPEINKDKK